MRYHTPLSVIEFPENLENKIFDSIFRIYPNYGIGEIRESILRLSQLYIKQKFITPWHEDWCKVAQLCYYFPVSYLRVKRVATILKRQGIFLTDFHWIDWGSGLSPLGWFFQIEGSNKTTKIFLWDRDSFPGIWSQKAGLVAHVLNREPSSISNQAIAFILSWNELGSEKIYSVIRESPFLLFIESGLKSQGRELLNLRELLRKWGYYILAPCTHQGSCPLLIHSHEDWCHDEFAPLWPSRLDELMRSLPFDTHSSIHLSYIVASKNLRLQLKKPDWRVIGRGIHQKGKSLQAICFDEKRRFLSWSHRYFKPRTIKFFERGDLLEPRSVYHERGSTGHLEIEVSSTDWL